MEQRTRTLVIGLGGAQLLSWGTLYYAVAVVAEPMRLALGVSHSALFGAFAWSLLISGVLAPWVGRTLDRLSARPILVAGTLVGALGFGVLAGAHSYSTLLIGWTINGVAMALGLYETCFAALAQIAPHAYRSAVTGVTLIAGFASTVSWPASHYLVQSIGWRATCASFAGILLLCLPLYLLLLPAHAPLDKSPAVQPSKPAPNQLRKQARWLALVFAGASFVAAAVSAHLVGTLTALNFSSEHAVWIASSVGVMQVLGRLLELGFGTRQTAIRCGFVTFAGLAASMLLLLAAATLPCLVLAFVVIYGVANGLATITKAALPVELFGLENVGAVLGSFSAPSLVTRAIAPLAYAAVIGEVGFRGALTSLLLVGTASLVAYTFVIRATARPHELFQSTCSCELPSETSRQAVSRVRPRAR